jgi:hypothetical protein
MRQLLQTAFVVLGSATMAEDLPVPPIPPERPPLADIAAVPNADARGPLAAVSSAPSVDVRFYRTDLHDPALGFAPGSRYQINEDRKLIQTPGVTVTVPLQ